MNIKRFKYIFPVVLVITALFTTILFPATAMAALTRNAIDPVLLSNHKNNTIMVPGNEITRGSGISTNKQGPLLSSNDNSAEPVTVDIPAGTNNVSESNYSSARIPIIGAIKIVANPTLATPTQTTEPSNGYERPVLVVNGYSISQEKITPGDYFIAYITLYNAGQHYARNIVATFTPGDLIPRETGGVVAVGEIAPGNRQDFAQPFILSTDVWSYDASINMTVTYADEAGFIYNENFVISLPVHLPYTAASTATPTPTITPIPSQKPQLVITGYSTDVNPLQPGLQFNLSLNVKNMGAATAKRVTMIVGGGNSTPGGNGGTQEPGGGISGAGGEFTNFAPIGASNVQSLGEFTPGISVPAIQPLIVNTTTNPGAYPLKISFVYLDDQNHTFTDDQVITLLVYRLPAVDINFYQELSPLYIGQMNMLPIQVVNLGKNSTVFGTMRVNSTSGQFSNNSILVGTLESGGYFTIDANFIPDMTGKVDLTVSIDYTNDFNQSQIITKTLSVEVMEQPFVEPPIDEGQNGGGEYFPSQPETFLQKIWRFILGLIGLDSGLNSSPEPAGDQSFETPFPEEQPIIVPAKPIKGP